MTESSTLYCPKCGFPTEYCEYSSVCNGQKKEAPIKEEVKIVVTTKRVSGNKKVTLVRNLHLLIGSAGLKEIAKKCSKTIACGSSIIKNGNGTEDITIQTSEDLKVIAILIKNGIPKERIERLTKA
ncbi:hypothetical protein NEHOM01_1314 [Nematocida homosporus]|uniref:uncharacterized protein n=1 Tax=Nematocida homosporus TaxID=1912981 RepID=UPI00221E99A1|nr:uncharacterized protein NEHOM01_1314 [Nematocida homosporus]KAI5186149.1 hypothetical protein NEHOM01_1314 [Nematocida homosporus]